MSEKERNDAKNGEDKGKPGHGKRVLLRTFGCQMNDRDSELLCGMLKDAGYEIVKDVKNTDVALFNTCSVRQHAEDRAMGNVMKLAHLKKNRPDLKIGVLGCMAQRRGGELLDQCEGLDLVLGSNNLYELPEMLEKLFVGERVVAVDKTKRPKNKELVSYRAGRFSSYVNIMYGCDNFCSYCVVPYVRGREISRAKKVIIREIKDLAQRGFKQVTLLGQNVNSYGKGQTSKVSFPELLDAVNRIKGIERIRFTTSHPKDASKDLFRAVRDLDKVCEHIHLPIQSGSNKILDLMNRGYTLEEYLYKAEMAKAMIPGLALSTDIIVGFPSEKRKDLDLTKRAMEKVGFDSAFIFKYSPRPPALSANLKEDVSEREKKRRNTELLELQRRISRKKNLEMVGTEQQVLVESVSRLSDKELTGRTRNNTPCVFPAPPEFLGKIVSVRIKDTTDNTLRGEISEK